MRLKDKIIIIIARKNIKDRSPVPKEKGEIVVKLQFCSGGEEGGVDVATNAPVENASEGAITDEVKKFPPPPKLDPK